MNFSTVSYLWPAALLLNGALLLFGLLYWSLYHYRRRHPFHSNRSRVFFFLRTGLFGLTWILLTLALMQPIGVGERKSESKVIRKKQSVALMIDASASMTVADTRTHQTRLAYAKEIADQILSSLNGNEAALYTFTSQLSKIVPFTLNMPFVRFMADQIAINEGGAAGTNFKNAFDELDIEPPDILILLSDGGDTAPQTEQRIEEIAALAKKRSGNIFTIGLGSKEGDTIPNILYQGKPVVSSLDDRLLKAISKRYYFANQMTPLDIAHDIKWHIDQETGFGNEKVSAATETTREPLFQYPLAIALLALLLFLFLPQRALYLLLLISPLQGDELKQGADYYQAKEYHKAEDTYEDLLKEPLTSWQRAVVLYNLATTEIAMNRPDKGLILLQTVPDTPLTHVARQRNEAIAYFRLAKKMNAPELYRIAIEQAEEAGLKEVADAAKVLLAEQPAELQNQIDNLIFNIRFYHEGFLPLAEDLGKRLRAYPAAQAEFARGTALLRQGKEKESIAAFELAKKSLPEENPLIRAYQLALGQKILFPFEGLPLKPQLKEQVEKGNLPLARVYLQDGLQEARRKEWDKEKPGALKTLEHTISEETHAIALIREKAPQTLIDEAQNQALKRSAPFLGQVYQEQEVQNRCAQQPWDKALPLFNSGVDKAKSSPFTALFDWYNAYTMIKEFKPPPPAPESHLDEALSYLQEMEDQPVKQPTVIPKEEKPW